MTEIITNNSHRNSKTKINCKSLLRDPSELPLHSKKITSANINMSLILQCKVLQWQMPQSKPVIWRMVVAVDNHSSSSTSSSSNKSTISKIAKSSRKAAIELSNKNKFLEQLRKNLKRAVEDTFNLMLAIKMWINIKTRLINNSKGVIFQQNRTLTMNNLKKRRKTFNLFSEAHRAQKRSSASPRNWPFSLHRVKLNLRSSH